MLFPPESLQKAHEPAPTPAEVSPVRLVLPSDLQNCKLVNLCPFKLLRLCNLLQQQQETHSAGNCLKMLLNRTLSSSHPSFLLALFLEQGVEV